MSTVTLKSGKNMILSPISEKANLLEQAASYMFGEWPTFWKDIGVPDVPAVIAWLKTCKGPDTFPYYVVGHIDGELIGFAGVDANEREGDPRGPWLIDVYVLDKFRGIGAFKPIVKHIMDTQKNLGVKEMWLWTKPHQKVLYEQLGWVYQHDEPWMTEDKGLYPMPVMTVQLNAASKL
jgi:GNAT superfamily N-acetyltransferase